MERSRSYHDVINDSRDGSTPNNSGCSPLTIDLMESTHCASDHDISCCSLPNFMRPISPIVKCDPTIRQIPSPRTRRKGFLIRDNSVHSDSSHYSSVDSLLESRKPDPEAILINLGFGPVESEDILSRIPKRFLKPSQVRGVDTEAFVKRLQLASHLHENSVLGYRGLTGNPDIPPSSIVAKIMQRFEVNERKKSLGSIETQQF